MRNTYGATLSTFIGDIWMIWNSLTATDMLYHTSKHCAFLIRFDDKVPISDTAKLKTCHGLTPMSHEKHLWGHPINIHWRYMDEME
jgi:hypothetical protein